jgi:hypothetical protein
LWRHGGGSKHIIYALWRHGGGSKHRHGGSVLLIAGLDPTCSSGTATLLPEADVAERTELMAAASSSCFCSVVLNICRRGRRWEEEGCDGRKKRGVRL